MKTGSVPPAIMKMSEHLWKPADITDDPDHIQPVIEKDGSVSGVTNPPVLPAICRNFQPEHSHTVSGVTNPPVLPETYAERTVMPTLMTFRPKRLHTDPDMPEQPRTADGGLIGTKVSDFITETAAERRFYTKRTVPVRNR